MLSTALLSSIAKQLMSGAVVEVADERIPVRRTSAGRLRTASFELDGKQYQAIEQNPDKPSRWGKSARDGHRVVQFKDVAANKFIAVSVDEKVWIYGEASHKRREGQ